MLSETSAMALWITQECSELGASWLQVCWDTTGPMPALLRAT